MQPEQQQRIMGYFIEEAKEHLNTIEQGLLNLQSTIEDSEMINEVFRAAHSVKGGAAMLGLSSIQQVSHRLEDFFKILREVPTQVDQKLETLFLQVFDVLKELLDQLQAPFGITDDAANSLLARVEPTFAELEQHLTDLVGAAAVMANSTVSASAPVATVSSESLFRNDIPALLREMLQLFKQPETETSRRQLADICRHLIDIGEQFDLSRWCSLVETAKRAIAQPDNSFRILAPVIIKDIKQAQELVLASRATEILPCSQLLELAPIAADSAGSTEADLLDQLAIADETDLLLLDSELSESDRAFELFTADNPEPTATFDTDLIDALDLDLETDETTPQHGPEVGIAELNSLADLFEGETPELGSTWQAEQVVSDFGGLAIDVDSAYTGLESESDFSDLLFEEENKTSLPLSNALNAMGELDDIGELDDMGDLFDEPLTPASSEDSDNLLSDDDLSEFFDLDGAQSITAESASTTSESDLFGGLDLDDLPDVESAPNVIAGDSADASLQDLGDLFAGMDETEFVVDETTPLLEELATEATATPPQSPEPFPDLWDDDAALSSTIDPLGNVAGANNSFAVPDMPAIANSSDDPFAIGLFDSDTDLGDVLAGLEVSAGDATAEVDQWLELEQPGTSSLGEFVELDLTEPSLFAELDQPAPPDLVDAGLGNLDLDFGLEDTSTPLSTASELNSSTDDLGAEFDLLTDSLNVDGLDSDEPDFTNHEFLLTQPAELGDIPDPWSENAAALSELDGLDQPDLLSEGSLDELDLSSLDVETSASHPAVMRSDLDLSNEFDLVTSTEGLSADDPFELNFDDLSAESGSLGDSIAASDDLLADVKDNDPFELNFDDLPAESGSLGDSLAVSGDLLDDAKTETNFFGETATPATGDISDLELDFLDSEEAEISLFSSEGSLEDDDLGLMVETEAIAFTTVPNADDSIDDLLELDDLSTTSNTQAIEAGDLDLTDGAFDDMFGLGETDNVLISTAADLPAETGDEAGDPDLTDDAFDGMFGSGETDDDVLIGTVANLPVETGDEVGDLDLTDGAFDDMFGLGETDNVLISTAADLPAETGDEAGDPDLIDDAFDDMFGSGETDDDVLIGTVANLPVETGDEAGDLDLTDDAFDKMFGSGETDDDVLIGTANLSAETMDRAGDPDLTDGAFDDMFGLGETDDVLVGTANLPVETGDGVGNLDLTDDAFDNMFGLGETDDDVLIGTAANLSAETRNDGEGLLELDDFDLSTDEATSLNSLDLEISSNELVESSGQEPLTEDLLELDDLDADLGFDLESPSSSESSLADEMGFNDDLLTVDDTAELGISAADFDFENESSTSDTVSPWVADELLLADSLAIADADDLGLDDASLKLDSEANFWGDNATAFSLDDDPESAIADSANASTDGANLFADLAEPSNPADSLNLDFGTPDESLNFDAVLDSAAADVSTDLNLDFGAADESLNFDIASGLDNFDSFIADPAADSNINDDLEALLAGDASIAAASEEFTEFDNLLDSSTVSSVDSVNQFDDSSTHLSNGTASPDEFAALDDLLADDLERDNFADLDDLLADDLAADAALSLADTGNITGSNDDNFADLDALLDADDGDFADSSLTPSADADFDELDDLLIEAEEKLGGTPSIKGSRSLTPRVARPNRMAEQTMRVPVKHLDNLSNLVGELVVNRNSLEQDQERLRQSLDNLLYQVQQLSDVGQRMQDLYERSLLESSLLASRQKHRVNSGITFSQPESTVIQANPDAVEYDPLEMDRFTGFHSLSQEMIELIVRVRESASDIGFIVDETDQVTRMFRQVTTQLQEGLTRSRMMPFAQTADRLPRAVRDISIKVGKQAELVIEGRETLIDKMILEKLYDPLTHLVNNAITHGIELPEVRRAANKSASGRIAVRAFHQGNQTIISVSDDGAGIDIERVKRKAVEKGLLAPVEAQNLSRLDAYDLLFHPGFSTADQVDEFRGRGVGMDVVRTSLSEIRGVINTDSTSGKGTTFTIRLPLTLSISKALCCISDRARIAFPMDGVEDMLDLPKERIQTNEEGQQCVSWRDTLMPLRPLSELLAYSRHLGRGNVYGGNQEDDIVSIVVLRSAGNYLALEVDQVLGEQEIVIKQLEGPVPKPVGVAGATVLGDGRIMPIADVLELIDLSVGRIRRDAGGSLWDKGGITAIQEPPQVKTEPMVLIVDDSITVRELLSMTFNKVGYRVEQARDGQEAWEKLRSGLPCDIVFCDIEMPRMDGLELLSRIQKDSALNHLPIAMLTSRGADRHRQMASTLGASGYFTKPYLEEALLDAAQRMLKGERLL